MKLIKRTCVSIALLVLLGSLVGTAFAAAGEAATEKNAALRWNEVLLQAVRDSNIGPPAIARALAVAHTCMYDAWAAYDRRARGTEFGDFQRRPESEHTADNKREAISYAAYVAAVDLFPSEKDNFDSLMLSLGYKPEAAFGAGASESPAEVGSLACAAVLETRHRDGANQLGDLHPGAYSDYTGYEPYNTPDHINDPERWQTLYVPVEGGYKVQTFLAPHWGQVKPFALQNPYRFKPRKPARYGTRAYQEQVKEVISYSAHLTDAQKVMAEYWADGPHSETPPGHWNLFAQFVSERDGHDLDSDVKMFFALNNAVMDAGIWSWWAKRKFDYVRPISAVRYLYAGKMIEAWGGVGQGTRSIPGETWKPYQQESFITPPFAEYVSGHSTFSAAAAEVLRRFTESDVFGYSVTFAPGSSFVEPGITPSFPLTLSWATFTDAANEAGLSRRYGGIHFKDADMEGRKHGRLIGELTWRKAQHLFNERR